MDELRFSAIDAAVSAVCMIYDFIYVHDWLPSRFRRILTIDIKFPLRGTSCWQIQ